MEKQKKKDVVAALRAEFASGKAVFVTDFKTMTVENMAGLRDKIRQNGATYSVVKNTLTKIAAKGLDAEKLEGLLTGNNGLGVTDGDPVVLAKVLQDFAKEQNKFVIKGGLLGSQVLSPAQVKALASLPSREVMLSSLLGTMQAVPASLVRVLAAVPRKLLYALAAVRDQKAEASGEAAAS
ncbi:MAG: 50S ribosomal protein L10 [Deltaproteobacteria bacterium]|nr:50S ribosomal protein L10 [Deltaproteobacteria bacterium]